MKGNITLATLVGWGITIGLASVGYTTMSMNKLSDSNISIVQRVSVVETKSDQYKQDISEINRKLDALLSAQGVKLGNISKIQ